MAIALKVDWVSGTLDNTADTYTLATPEVPNALVLGNVGDPSLDVGTGLWAGQTIFNCVNWYDGADVTGVSGMPRVGRLLMQVDPVNMPAASSRLILRMQNDASWGDFRLDIFRNGSFNLQVRLYLNSGSGIEHYVDFGAWPTNPFNIEAIFDSNNATESQRLRARYWDVGSSAPAFTNRTGGSGTYQGTPSQFPDHIMLCEPDNQDVKAKFGKIFVSDDITEDLSALLGGASPKRMMMMGAG